MIIPDENGWAEAEKLALSGDQHFEKIMLSYDLHIQSLKSAILKRDHIRAELSDHSDRKGLNEGLVAAETAVQDEERRMFYFRCLVAQQVRDRQKSGK